MITVPIHEGSYRSIIPMLPWCNYFIAIVTIQSVTCFPGNKAKSSARMISYPEEI